MITQYSNSLFTKDDKSFKVELPGEKFYEEEIYIKTLTFGDISQLATIIGQSDEKRMCELIQEKLSIDILKLTLFDFYYLLYWHRFNSYNESDFPLNISFRCSNVDCLETNHKPLKLKNIRIKSPNQKMKKPYIKVKFLDDKVAKFRIPTVADYLTSIDLIKELKIKENSELIITTLCLDFIDEDELNKSIKSKLSYLKKLSTSDFLLIKEAERSISYGIEDKTGLECSYCSESQEVVLNTSMFDLFPDFPSQRSMESRIFFDCESDEDESTTDLSNGISKDNVSKESIYKGTTRSVESEKRKQEDNNGLKEMKYSDIKK